MNLPSTLLACATCMGDSGTDIAQATSTAIFFMVGLVGSVLSVFLYAIINFARKQRQFAQSNP